MSNIQKSSLVLINIPNLTNMSIKIRDWWANQIATQCSDSFCWLVLTSVLSRGWIHGLTKLWGTSQLRRIIWPKFHFSQVTAAPTEMSANRSYFKTAACWQVLHNETQTFNHLFRLKMFLHIFKFQIKTMKQQTTWWTNDVLFNKNEHKCTKLVLHSVKKIPHYSGSRLSLLLALSQNNPKTDA